MDNDYYMVRLFMVMLMIIILVFQIIPLFSPAPSNDIPLDDFDVYRSISMPQVQEIPVYENDGGDYVEDDRSEEVAVSDDGIGDASEEYPESLGTPYDWPEWLEEEPADIEPYTLENDEASENAVRLARIEYHLSVISGGVILAVCSAFVWFTILKPIKSFIIF